LWPPQKNTFCREKLRIGGVGKKKHKKLEILQLRWGWVFVEGIDLNEQYTTYFIESFVVETKQFIGSFVNVILTRQTCGQRSSRAAESKHRGKGNYFSE